MSETTPEPIAPALLAILAENHYFFPKRLATGEVAALQKFIYTVGLCVGLDETGLRTRFCFPDFGSALQALLAWDGFGDPPGPWIKEKGEIERARPNIGGIPVNVERVVNAQSSGGSRLEQSPYGCGDGRGDSELTPAGTGADARRDPDRQTAEST